MDNIVGFLQGLKKNNAPVEKCLPIWLSKAIGLIKWKALKGRSPSTENVLAKSTALLLADLQSVASDPAIDPDLCRKRSSRPLEAAGPEQMTSRPKAHTEVSLRIQ